MQNSRGLTKALGELVGMFLVALAIMFGCGATVGAFIGAAVLMYRALVGAA